MSKELQRAQAIMASMSDDETIKAAEYTQRQRECNEAMEKEEKLKRAFNAKPSISLKEAKKLRPGDFVLLKFVNGKDKIAMITTNNHDVVSALVRHNNERASEELIETCQIMRFVSTVQWPEGY